MIIDRTDPFFAGSDPDLCKILQTITFIDGLMINNAVDAFHLWRDGSKDV